MISDVFLSCMNPLMKSIRKPMKSASISQSTLLLKLPCYFIDIMGMTELGRVKSLVRTEDLSDDDCKRHFTSITGEDAAQILELAAAPVNGDNLKKLLHVTVILANEIGQPAGRTCNSGDEDPPPKKKKKNHDLLQRVADLEKSKEDNVKELKDKVRSLALQANPSEPLILLSLDELAKKARRQNDDDAETFDELARQAQRHQGSINVATLTLNVLGGKASDLVGKAMGKCLKEKEVEQKITWNKANHMEKWKPLLPWLMLTHLLPVCLTISCLRCPLDGSRECFPFVLVCTIIKVLEDLAQEMASGGQEEIVSSAIRMITL
ncbi:unnamed protein product [Mytilus coruscus]|uniref:Uncharacterized protein n=1 Tax=Mytilus coruscus TaxID=42192 RepID=A0A6J8E4K2_MYTCO|nr:unnamed protein product [Mytilus coruscus]